MRTVYVVLWRSIKVGRRDFTVNEYLLGVYSDEKVAEEKADKKREEPLNFVMVIPIELDEREQMFSLPVTDHIFKKKE